ncbi:MAG: ATP-dependent sacrificial sulfur transferase LarE [Planctomycetota bacterium]|jgi:uncharacterized protein
MNTLNAKEDRLKNLLQATGGVVVGYSGGVDSTYLARMATEVLGERAIVVTAASETYPEWERNQAKQIAQENGFNHRLFETSELAIPGFANNEPDRCYHCKGELFRMLWSVAEKEGVSAVADGTTADDLNDFRPGRRAAKELKVLSPLLDAELSKDEIRELSKRLGLVTWDKPAFACLSSRFPYGQNITPEKLAQVEAAETFLRDQGIRQFRVRHYGEMARIEVEPKDIPRLAGELREPLAACCKTAGFKYVTLDLEGYRTGSMNEVLSEEAKGEAL